MGEMASSVSALRNVVFVGLTFLSASCSQICCARMSVFSSRLDKARRIAGLRAMFSSIRRSPFSWEASLMRLTLSGVADARARLTPSDPMKSFERLAAREGATLRHL